MGGRRGREVEGETAVIAVVVVAVVTAIIAAVAVAVVTAVVIVAVIIVWVIGCGGSTKDRRDYFFLLLLYI